MRSLARTKNGAERPDLKGTPSERRERKSSSTRLRVSVAAAADAAAATSEARNRAGIVASSRRDAQSGTFRTPILFCGLRRFVYLVRAGGGANACNDMCHFNTR